MICEYCWKFIRADRAVFHENVNQLVKKHWFCSKSRKKKWLEIVLDKAYTSVHVWRLAEVGGNTIYPRLNYRLNRYKFFYSLDLSGS